MKFWQVALYSLSTGSLAFTAGLLALKHSGPIAGLGFMIVLCGVAGWYCEDAVAWFWRQR